MKNATIAPLPVILEWSAVTCKVPLLREGQERALPDRGSVFNCQRANPNQSSAGYLELPAKSAIHLSAAA
jgi:hypothetical protein